MGKIINECVKETLLTEDIKKQIVVYAGRFQPFHKGHYASYQQLVKKFGKENVYIGTSDKTDTIKSPLRFKEKREIMMKMFGIPASTIVQIKNPYIPMEILNKFPEETTAFITVVGEKDRYRLKGKYFEPYHPDRVTKGYKEAGYVYVTTAQGSAGGMSGTEARSLLLKGSEADKIAGFKKVYDGKFDSKIYKLITTKLEKVFGKMERFISTIDMNQLMVEAGIYNADAGEPETGYLPGGTSRVLGDNFGKPEPWYSAGGYTQMEFPKADYIYSKDSTGSDKASFSVVKRVEPNRDLDTPIEADDYLTSETGEPIIGMNEASSIGPLGKSVVDDGPGFTYGNSKSYRKVGEDTAEALGWQVVDYILGTDDDSIYADSLRTLDDKYPVSYFPSGAEGIDAQSQRYNIMKSGDAYKAWSKKIKGVATAVGYQLINFLDAEDSKTNNPNEPTKETTPNFTVDSKTERLGEGIRESVDNIKWQASVDIFMRKAWVPLSTSIINKMVGESFVQTWHVTDANHVGNVMKLQGKKKSLSTFNASDSAWSPITGKGMWTKGGVVIQMYGQLMAQGNDDLWSAPDKQGRRWVDPTYLFGRGVLKINPSWITDDMTATEKRDVVKKYIDNVYKEMYKHRIKFIQKLISDSHSLHYEADYNEVIVNQIRIGNVFAIKGQVSDSEIETIKKYWKAVKVVTEDELKKIFKRKGGYLREDVGPKWQRSTFELMQNRHVPLSPSIVNKMLGDITVEVYHTTDNNGLDKLMKLQGKKKSISTFDASDRRGPAAGFGMWTKGGIVAKIEGTLLARSVADLWSKPDKQGRRWVSTVNGFGRTPFEFGLPEIEKQKEEYTPEELRQLTKDYIDTAYTKMYKHREEFRRRSIESANRLNVSDGWNEAVVNNIKVTALYVNKLIYSPYEIKKIKQKYKVPVITAVDANNIANKLKDNGVHIRDNVNINRTDILTEGGAYGHMNHPFDVEMNLTFGDLKAIIKGALTGNLEFTREKTDGQALAISWRNDRGLIAARNKSHLKNSGEGALNIKGVADKFANRGGLTDAYNFAMKDLEKAIKGLTSKQRDKIFQNGGSFMNLEVIYPTSVNVIPYGQPLLVFHGTMQYDEAGNPIGENPEAGRMLAGMIKQVNAHVQDNYTISGPTVTELPKSVKLSSLQGKFTSQLSKLQSEFNLKDADGVAEYHQAWWMGWIKKNVPGELNDTELKGLVTRWAFFDKKFTLNNKTISNTDVLDWAKKIDKQDHSKMAKDNLRKFEDIFLGVGAEVLSAMDSIITVSPDKATRDMKARLDQTIKDVKSSGDPKKIQKLKSELERLQVIGGSDKIVPNEGIVFTYKGNTYKLTGAFASLNQILGLMYF